jgi:hypothetical protein
MYARAKGHKTAMWGEPMATRPTLLSGPLCCQERSVTVSTSDYERLVPKTASSARVITLPPFLTGLLRRHLQRHNNEFVFTAESESGCGAAPSSAASSTPPSMATKPCPNDVSGPSPSDRD